MGNTISSLERCRVIRDPRELNSEGCRFFIEADNVRVTKISSTRLRWLTHENQGSSFFTKEQEDAVKKIVEGQRRNDMAPPFLMHLLLYSDPRNLSANENQYIKALLQCVGVDMRYLRTREEQRLRIAIRGRKMFLSLSGNQINEVHEGILYETNCNSPLLNYFESVFDRDFNMAKRLRLVRGRIVFADNWIIRFKNWCKTDKAVGIIMGIIGMLVTVLFSVLGPWRK